MMDFAKRFKTILYTAEEDFAKGAETLPLLIKCVVVVGAVVVLVAQFLPQFLQR